MRPFIVLSTATCLLAAAALYVASSASAELRRHGARLELSQARLASSIQDLEERLEAERERHRPDGLLPARPPAALPAPRRAVEAEPTAALSEAPDPEDELRHEELLRSFPGLEGEAKEDALEDLAELAVSGDGRARQLILASLEDGDPRVREEAVEALGELADPALIGHLELAAEDPSSRVREEVADALRGMPPELGGPILAGLLADPDAEVVEEALDALRSVDYPGAVPRIAELIRGDDLALVSRAARTLRRMGAADLALEGLERIARDLESLDALDRIDAIHHIRRIGGDEAIAHLERVLARDTNDTVRLEAQRALQRLRG